MFGRNRSEGGHVMLRKGVDPADGTKIDSGQSGRVLNKEERRAIEGLIKTGLTFKQAREQYFGE